MGAFSLCVLAVIVVTSSGMNIRRTRDVSSMADASEYLARLGYFMESTNFNADSTKSALMRFQQTFHLPMTGTLNADTMDKLNQPRCSNADDNLIASGSRRKRRYALQGSKWPKLELTYKVTQYTNDLPRNDIDVLVRESFRVWSDVTPLRFYRSDSDEADILILFVRGDHGDGGPFDGEGGTYAHAYYPQYGGDAHFDDDERWTIGTTEGVNFFQVCVHEFGHSLGLLHSGVENAIMEPYYQGYRPGWRLHQDDVDGIQEIYGSRGNPKDPSPTTSPTTTTSTTSTTSSTTPATTTSTTSSSTSTTRSPKTSTTTRRTTVPTNPGDNGACSVKRWDAVVTVDGGDTYFFAGQHYYKLGDNKVEARRARVISQDWTGLPSDVDSAVTLNGGLTVIFKDDSFYLFRGQGPYDSNVRKSSHYFPYLPEQMDAAWVWPGNNKLYVTKGLDYWRMDWGKANNTDYPRVFAQWWPGVPAAADAANRFTDNNLHFFIGNTYFVFDVKQDKVVGGQRSVGLDFFGCEAVPMNPTIPEHPDRIDGNFQNPPENPPMAPNSEMEELAESGQAQALEGDVMKVLDDPSGFVAAGSGASDVTTSVLHVTLMSVIAAVLRRLL